ncbi:protein GRIM REAPER-like [Malania oleifera]|uniref:protein GRIM REAPER-like n=1 Tax=Malania oleifera TaxID=397392 RepID=UPI0025AE8487|nr:protein GRIM REAPER-like [Malania oleifera]
MATALLSLTAILLSLAFPLMSQAASPSPMASLMTDNPEDYEEYIIDAPFLNTGSLRSRFLTSIVKKGAHCDAVKNNICNGVSANNGESRLSCCKKHCRNVLGDKNNCGQCGHKCSFGERCCGGTCTNVTFNASHCGQCNNACTLGVKCENGLCGYT